MSEFIEQVAQTIVERHLLKRADRIVVAVSGGLDSMVLLDSLHRLAPHFGWKLVVAHFNHQLRQAESDRDEQWVRQTAQRLGLEFVSERWPPAAQAFAQKHGLEMAARLARHEFLARAAGTRRIRTIALAQHADDQAELFFLRLFRGAGGEGLAGMKWAGPGPIADAKGVRARLVRPFLDFNKSDLQRHADACRIRFREDASNAFRRHARNRVRHDLLPLLVRRFEPAIVKMIVRTMDLAGTDTDFARQAAEQWLEAAKPEPFQRLHPAVQRHCLRLQLTRLKFVATYDLVEFLRQHPQRVITVHSGCALSRDRTGKVMMMETVPAEHAPAPFVAGEISIELGQQTGSCRFDGVKADWKLRRTKREFKRPPQRPGREYFDAARVGSPVTLRHWREGDRFQPIGMKSAIKLQDLFTNLKIPRARRHQLVVATTGTGEIWWVEGLRLGERFKLGPATRSVLEWRWERAMETGQILQHKGESADKEQRHGRC